MVARFFLSCGLVLCTCLGTSWAKDVEPAEKLTPEQHFTKAKEYIEEKGDFFSAMLHLKPAAEAGHLRAQVWYARFLDDGEDNDLAEKYYGMAVKQGDPEAKLGLAVMHISGDAAKPDLAVALKLVREAAQDGYAPAVSALAAAYIQGGLGLDAQARESPEALQWINKAAELGDILSLRRLEHLYRTGGHGLAVDLARAEQIKAKINELTGVAEKQETGRRRRK
jgi:TPR repeat protein